MPSNPHRRKVRLAAAAVLMLLLGLAWFAGFRPTAEAGEKQPAGDAANSAATAAPRLETAGEAKGTRAAKVTTNADKLRSLLEVREGEVAFISLPPECLAASIGSGPTMENPICHGVISRDRLEGMLVAAKGENSRIQGQVQAMKDVKLGKSLKWSSERWNVEALVMSSETDDIMQLQMTEKGEETQLVTATIPRGEMILLLSSYPETEGLVIFLGGDSAPEPQQGPPVDPEQKR